MYKSISLVQLEKVKIPGCISKVSGPAYQIKLDKRRSVTLGAVRNPDNGQELRVLLFKDGDTCTHLLLTKEALTAIAHLGAELTKALNFAKMLTDIPTLQEAEHAT